MNLLDAILKHEVYPALGCTEPVSCAYAAAVAASHLGEDVKQLEIRVDLGTFKNGAAVTVPFTQGKKGNLIAGALGAELACPEEKLELLRKGKSQIAWLDGEHAFRVEAQVGGRKHTVLVVLAGGHTNIERIAKDGQDMLRQERSGAEHHAVAYRRELRDTDLRTVLSLAAGIDAEKTAYLRRGVEMNEAMSERGFEIQRTAYQLMRMKEKGYVSDDVFFRVKLRVASAVDARMAGVEQAVMTSGGAGNQGVVATLTPYIVGKEMNVGSPHDECLCQVLLGRAFGGLRLCDGRGNRCRGGNCLPAGRHRYAEDCFGREQCDRRPWRPHL